MEAATWNLEKPPIHRVTLLWDRLKVRIHTKFNRKNLRNLKKMNLFDSLEETLSKNLK